MRFSSLLLASLLFVACSRKEVNNNLGIVGKWQMIASQDLTGRWVDASGPFYHEFTNDGKMITINGEYHSITDYALTGDGKITFNASGQEVTREYTIKGNVLTLGGPCFEPCLATFSRR